MSVTRCGEVRRGEAKRRSGGRGRRERGDTRQAERLRTWRGRSFHLLRLLSIFPRGCGFSLSRRKSTRRAFPPCFSSPRSRKYIARSSLHFFPSPSLSHSGPLSPSLSLPFSPCCRCPPLSFSKRTGRYSMAAPPITRPPQVARFRIQPHFFERHLGHSISEVRAGRSK